MIAKIYSAIPQGYEGHIVTVEGDSNRGLPAFNIVGMANKTISESRERVRAALTNSGFSFPTRKVTINLAPAELSKDGAHLDLPIALAILVLSQQLLASDVANSLFVGELSLDGLTKPVRGIINIVEAAQKLGFKTIFVPTANLPIARLVNGIEIIGVSNLLELFLHLKGTKVIQPTTTPVRRSNTKNSERTHKISVQPSVVKNTGTDEGSLAWASIRGHSLAKRALTIALAGRHNILLTGPPGAGKTLLARATATLQPPPSHPEQLEIAKIHALVGELPKPPEARPFRSPHHSASSTSIIGGGLHAQPGEISLAHGGILFLDELPEYRRDVLEALRQPLEERCITVSRANQRLVYPANFMLVATMNPCPCGYYGDPTHQCTCSANEIRKYQNRLSGPILDRIDLIIPISPVKQSELAYQQVRSLSVVENTQTDIMSQPTFVNGVVKNTKTDIQQAKPRPRTDYDYAYVKNTIKEAETRQFQRYQQPGKFNASLSSVEIMKYVKIKPDAQSFLQAAANKMNLSTRSYFKILKVAQTISDLSGQPTIGTNEISEALSYRIRQN